MAVVVQQITREVSNEVKTTVCLSRKDNEKTKMKKYCYYMKLVVTCNYCFVHLGFTKRGEARN